MNGVTQLYASSERDVQVNAVLRLVYFAGMILLLLATPVSFFFYWNARQEEPLLRRIRQRFKRG
ncbi:MAG: hypothetical protein HZT42_00025 [Paracoccaceae bacterium]|nr:MAG: hypothetical protein HZT42_00025 [Paracoccaceae bacterium]